MILFSIGYGPDETGKVALNFGPLNRDGGWRRLNVAVSRARKEMRVYSTIGPEQIDLSRTRSEGVAGLKAFLEFAKRGKEALASPIDALVTKKTGFSELVARRIRQMGYQVRTDVGCSAFKIDLAVVDPEKPDSYLLGILCDGEHYREAKTARDRNMNQESVLRQLGGLAALPLMEHGMVGKRDRRAFKDPGSHRGGGGSGADGPHRDAAGGEKAVPF